MSQITIHATVKAPVKKVWKYWTEPEHIIKWNQASPDWHCPTASNDLQVGGRFSSVMAAKDGSVQFEFGGEYTQVVPHEVLEYKMDDGRMVHITFEAISEIETKVTETFDSEDTHTIEQQRDGWQSILDNFKQYVENEQ